MEDACVMPRRFPYKITDLDPKVNEEVAKGYDVDIGKLVQVGPEKWLISENYRTEASKYYNLKVRPDDIWITGFPRSGTTLLKEITWLLVNNLDYERAKSTMANRRVPFLEGSMGAAANVTLEKAHGKSAERSAVEEFIDAFTKPFKTLDNATGRRVAKSHLPYSLLPPELLTSGCKIIYIARNPKDTVVSNYFLQRILPSKYSGSLEQFFDYFRRNLINYTPYWQHLKQAWEKRDTENFLFIFYEDLVRDFRTSVQKIADFVGTTLNQDQVDDLETYFKFDNFKKNWKVANRDSSEDKGDSDFIRKGKIGGWKDYFTPELTAEVDKWIEENAVEVAIEFS